MVESSIDPQSTVYIIEKQKSQWPETELLGISSKSVIIGKGLRYRSHSEVYVEPESVRCFFLYHTSSIGSDPGQLVADLFCISFQYLQILFFASSPILEHLNIDGFIELLMRKNCFVPQINHLTSNKIIGPPNQIIFYPQTIKNGNFYLKYPVIIPQDLKKIGCLYLKTGI